MDVQMSGIDAPFTNVTLQTFATEGDMALVNQKWEKFGSKYIERLNVDFCHMKLPKYGTKIPSL